MSIVNKQRCFQFGPFFLDSKRYLLLREGRPVELTHKAFELLKFLVENHRKTLDKELLLRTVWAGSVVEEANLSQTIYKIRKALSEDRDRHEYIKTVPKIGYRFTGEVDEVWVEADSVSVERKGEAADHALRLRALAVMPFRLLGEGPGMEYLGLGMADAVITKVSSLRHLMVRPTSAISKYVNVSYDPAAIAKDLNIDALLEGTVQVDDGRVRVTVQLVRVPGYYAVWVEKYDEALTDVFAVQDAISEHVARALGSKITTEESVLIAKRHTANAEAFLAHIKGRYFWNKRTVEGLSKSIEYALRAIELDPTYALAYAGLADSYNLLASHAGLSPKETFRKARAAALRALELDDSLAEGYNSFAFICYRHDWDWALAAENYSRAVSFNPSYATAFQWHGELLTVTGRFNEASAYARKALELDPLSVPANAALGRTLFYSKRYEECEQQLRKTYEMDPNFFRTYVLMALVLEQTGKLGEALDWARRAAELSPDNPLPLSSLGYLYGVSGRRQEARAVLNRLKSLAAERYVSAHNIAAVYNGLREDEAVAEWLEFAYRERDVWLVWLGVTPHFERHRRRPWFSDLLRRIGFARKEVCGAVLRS